MGLGEISHIVVYTNTSVNHKLEPDLSETVYLETI